MKANFILIFLLAFVVSLSANAGNGNNNPQQTKEEKKTLQPKYDFNIFKFFFIPTQPQTDSLKKIITPRAKSTLFFSKNQFILNPKQSSLTI